MGEIIGQVLVEVLFYGTGRVIAPILFPALKIAPFEKQKSAVGWKWRGFTYNKGSERYLYTESIQVIGFVFWAFVGCAILLVQVTA
jgi:hypothetical protein